MTLLRGLFSPSVVATDTRLDAQLAALSSTEQESVKRAVPKRVREFRAGRHCAKQALLQLGIELEAIPVSADRSPCWPRGIVGSICHTSATPDGYAAAAVARRETHEGVGVDAEPFTPLPEGVRTRVLSEMEWAAIAQRSDAPDVTERLRLARLYFSAKEAVYKCLYPSARRFFDFHAVTITLGDARCSFAARLNQTVGPFDEGLELEGRCLTENGLVVTAIELLA